jgi:hypothetical protein
MLFGFTRLKPQIGGWIGCDVSVIFMLSVVSLVTVTVVGAELGA